MTRKKRNRRKKPVPKPFSAVGWEVAHVWFGVGALPLTEQLIEKLVGQGWRRSELENFRAKGALYSAQRDSIVFPENTWF